MIRLPTSPPPLSLSLSLSIYLSLSLSLSLSISLSLSQSRSLSYTRTFTCSHPHVFCNLFRNVKCLLVRDLNFHHQFLRIARHLFESYKQSVGGRSSVSSFALSAAKWAVGTFTVSNLHTGEILVVTLILISR